jgi:predicted nucleic acid-binding protein
MIKTFYFDSSAYVKLYSQEVASDLANQFFTLAKLGRVAITMSYWAINETYAAIDRKIRKKEISPVQRKKIIASINNNMIKYGTENSNIGLVSVTNEVLKNSFNMIEQYRISADDALHFYSAYVTNSNYFVCHDHKLVNAIKNNDCEIEVIDITNTTMTEVMLSQLK